MSIFSAFDVVTKTYKVVGDLEITVDIILPKNLPQGKRPVIARFHGGFLITGTSLFEEWFPPWLLEYATRHAAVIVSANYRLLPEANGLDIRQDQDDFWTWLHAELPGVLAARKVEVDLGRILATGESAGGYLSVQFGFAHREQNVRAVIAEFPTLDLQSPHFTQKYDKHIFGVPLLPENTVDDYLKTPAASQVIAAAIPPARAPLLVAILQQGRYLEFFGTERDLFPFERLEDGEVLPPLFILHGKEDLAVPVEGSEAFVRKLKEKNPAAEVTLSIQPGDHGFDHGAKLDDSWLQEGLQGVTRAWLN